MVSRSGFETMRNVARTLILIAISVVATLAAAQESARFSSQSLNLQFEYPGSWKLSRPFRDMVQLALPIEGSERTARVEVWETTFLGERDAWQESQRAFAENNKWSVARQWVEELGGVPLLLTQVNATGEGGSQVIQVGLLYNRANRKMMFRLHADPLDFDKANVAWREALLSLRTVDGGKLEVEDPGRVNSLPVGRDGRRVLNNDRKATLSVEANAGRPKPVVGPVTVAAEAGGRSFTMRLPEGWRAEKGEGDAWTLQHPELSGPVTVRALSTVDSDPAVRAYLRAMGESLGAFRSVKRREEGTPEVNAAGATAGWTWRIGVPTDGTGNLAGFDGMVASGDFYLLVRFRSTNAERFDRDRQTLRALILGTTLQTAP